MSTALLPVLVAVAGGLGASARFIADTVIARHNRLSMPVGTLVVNVTACLLLGSLTGWTLSHLEPGGVGAVAAVGFLGGYSTFSTASVEGARLLLADRNLIAAGHAVGMLLASVAGAALGLFITGGIST